MLPARISLFAGAMAILLVSGVEVIAAGPGRGPSGPAIGATGVAGHSRHAIQRGFQARRADPAGRQIEGRFRHHDGGRRPRLALGGAYPYWPGPAYAGAGSAILLHEVPPEAGREPDGRDPHAFENLPTRTGIPRPPTPNPTFYRIEGPRDRPTTRIIRIADAQLPGSRRDRFVHIETGALLLTVPPR